MVKVKAVEAVRFTSNCLRAVGAMIEPAEAQAALLTYADLMGNCNRGLSRLDTYLKDITSGNCKPNNKPEILFKNRSTAMVDAKNVMGATAGTFAMELAMKMAVETGVGWVAVNGSTHTAEPYSYWSQKAADNGLVGLVYNKHSETHKEEDTEQYKVTTVTEKVEKKTIKQSPSRVLPLLLSAEGSQLSPSTLLGSFRRRKSAKRVKEGDKSPVPALAVMLEIFRGISWVKDEALLQNVGDCFVVANPTCFAVGFHGKFTSCMQHWRDLDPMNPNLLEQQLCNSKRSIASAFDEDHTLCYKIQQIQNYSDIAKNLSVQPMNLLEEY